MARAGSEPCGKAGRQASALFWDNRHSFGRRGREVDGGISLGRSAWRGGDPDNPTFTVRLPQPIRTTGLRVLFTQVRASPSIFEVEAWNNPAGTLSGRVADPEGRPIEGATVSAGGDMAQTDAQGWY